MQYLVAEFPVKILLNHLQRDRREVRSLWLTGRAGVTVAEAARAMVEEARQMLQKDLGIHIDWASSQERESSLVAAASINGRRSRRMTSLSHISVSSMRSRMIFQ